MPSAGNASPMKLVVLARHDAEQRALAGAVQAEHADLRAGEKREPDVLENFGVGRMDLPETLHGVDELGHSCELQIADCRLQIVRLQIAGRYVGCSRCSIFYCNRQSAISNLQSAICIVPCAASSTSTWTRSTRRSSSATIRRCAAGRSPSAGGPTGAASWRRRATRRARSACARRCRWPGRSGSVRRSSSCRPTSRGTRPRRARCSRSFAR